MAFDQVALASFSLHATPGSYALLLGAGISMAANVPSAWEVSARLIQELAALHGEEIDLEDTEGWWGRHQESPPTYSSVLAELAPAVHERQAILRRLFEPSPDGDEAIVEPTLAHRSIARLVASGHIRVIVTTNFDLLLERAIREQGIEPYVVATPNDAEGLPPLHTLSALVVHIHGDYLSPTSMRNTKTELASYGPELDRLVSEIVATHGLFIVGWSAVSDEALRGLTYGCPLPDAREFASDKSPALAAYEIEDYSSRQFNNVAVAADSGPNPTRTIDCTVRTTAGHVFTASSAPWTENDSRAAAIVCPAIPPGEIPSSYTFIEHGGGASQVIGSGTTTSAYQTWLTSFPECSNGSCPLILSKNGDSCFEQGIICGGWLNDHTTGYTCTYGTHQVPLSTCNIYGPTFASTNIATGHAYGDPTTGALTEAQTSPTARDIATRSCVSAYDNPAQGGLATLGSASGLTRSDWSSRCGSTAIFVTGGDTPLSTAHDIQAIAENPQRMFLTFVRGNEKPRTQWYSSDPICVEANSHSLDCDEFPFQSTEQGKNGLHELGTPSLAGVPGIGDNRTQGSRLGIFYGLCFADANVRDAAERDFIVVTDSTLPTGGYCVP